MSNRPGFDAVVIGLGETGFACARHLHGQGRRVAVTDTRDEPPRAADLAATCPEVVQRHGGLDGRLLAEAALVVISPGVDPRLAPIAEARAAGVPVVGEIELFARAATAPVVAITGSNGKSTVTTLVGEMGRAAGWRTAVGGNLGTPALALLADPEPDVYVLELSSFQLETVSSLDAAAAVVLNVSADHMDRYADVDVYAAAKQRIYRGHGAMVVNAEDPRVTAMAVAGRPLRRFGLRAPAGPDDAGIVVRDGREWLVLGERPVLAVDELAVTGRHNRANVLAALALGDAVGLPFDAMAEAARRFPGLPHRMEALGVHGGRRWFNDSKGTNVGATVAAVQGLERPFVLIAGGQGKGQSFAPLAEALAGRARAAVLIGESAGAIAAALDGAVAEVRAADMRDAVARAAGLTRPGEAVVLSPACASFDMFAGYAERGEAFRAAVEALGDG